LFIFECFSHTPTNVDLSKLPKIERTMIKLDRLIGKGAFGLLLFTKTLFLRCCSFLGEVYAGTMMENQLVAIKV